MRLINGLECYTTMTQVPKPDHGYYTIELLNDKTFITSTNWYYLREWTPGEILSFIEENQMKVKEMVSLTLEGANIIKKFSKFLALIAKELNDNPFGFVSYIASVESSYPDQFSDASSEDNKRIIQAIIEKDFPVFGNGENKPQTYNEGAFCLVKNQPSEEQLKWANFRKNPTSTATSSIEEELKIKKLKEIIRNEIPIPNFLLKYRDINF